MAIRRISELPRISEDEKNNLSSALMEFSLSESGENFKSVCGEVSEIENVVVNNITNSPIEHLKISGDLSVLNSDVIFNKGDTNVNDRKFVANFGDITIRQVGDVGTITLSANNSIKIDGNPVVINDNLSVWKDKTETVNPVNFTNNSNRIYVKDISDGDDTHLAVNYNYINSQIQTPLNDLANILGRSADPKTLKSQIEETRTVVNSLYTWIHNKLQKYYEEKPEERTPPQPIPPNPTIDGLSTYITECGMIPDEKPFKPDCVTYQFKSLTVDPSHSKYTVPTWDTAIDDVTHVFKNGITDIFMPGVTTLKRGSLFSGYKYLSAISLDDLENISSSGEFNGCESLKKVSFGNVKTVNGLTFNEKCTSLEIVEMPSLTSITGSGGFIKAPNVTTIKLGPIDKIPYNAFLSCYQLNNITFGSDSNQPISEIGQYAFKGCKNLKTIPMKPTGKIKTDAFKVCTALEKIDLSETTDVGATAFQNCTSLSNIGQLNENFKCTTTSFRGCTSLTDVDITYDPLDISDTNTQKICKRIYDNILTKLTGYSINPTSSGTNEVTYHVYPNFLQYLNDYPKTGTKYINKLKSKAIRVNVVN